MPSCLSSHSMNEEYVTGIVMLSFNKYTALYKKD